MYRYSPYCVLKTSSKIFFDSGACGCGFSVGLIFTSENDWNLKRREILPIIQLFSELTGGLILPAEKFIETLSADW